MSAYDGMSLKELKRQHIGALQRFWLGSEEESRQADKELDLIRKAIRRAENSNR